MKRQKILYTFVGVIAAFSFTALPVAAVVGSWSTNGNDMYYTDGNIGVGTSTPKGKMTLQDSTTNLNSSSNYSNRNSPLGIGDVTGSGYAILMDGNQIEQAGGTALHMNLNSSQSIYMVNGGGSVGIGTQSPAGRLDVVNSFYTDTGAINLRAFDAASEGGQIKFIGAGSNKYFYIDNFNGDMRILTQDAVGESEKVRIENNGSVGIGTTDPSAKLHVSGNAGVLNLEGTDHAYIQYYPDGFGAGRKAWVGFGGASSNTFSITNQVGDICIGSC